MIKLANSQFSSASKCKLTLHRIVQWKMKECKDIYEVICCIYPCFWPSNSITKLTVYCLFRAIFYSGITCSTISTYELQN